MVNIPTTVLIANAFYAKQENYMTYEEILEFKKILYTSLANKVGYVSFNDPKSFWPYPERVEQHRYEIGDYTFIKEIDGILCVTGSPFDKELIDGVNWIYDKDIRELIDVSRNLYANKKVRNYTRKK